MLRKSFGLLGGLALLLIAGCASSNSPTANTSPASSSAASPSAPARTGIKTTTDPCQLVTAAEASSLSGASFSAGTEQANSGGSNTCVYTDSQTGTLFEVTVAIASDAGTAQAEWAQEETQAQNQLVARAFASGFHVTINVSDFSLTGADRAAVGTGTGSFNGVTIAGIAVYALKGPIFFTFSDLRLNSPAAGATAMQGQAATVLTRLP